MPRCRLVVHVHQKKKKSNNGYVDASTQTEPCEDVCSHCCYFQAEESSNVRTTPPPIATIPAYKMEDEDSVYFELSVLLKKSDGCGQPMKLTCKTADIRRLAATQGKLRVDNLIG